MARYTKSQKFIPKAVGPSGDEFLSFKFSTATTAMTVLEEAGGLITQPTAGTYLITLGKTYKMLIPTLGIQSATLAQTFVITAQTSSSITLVQTNVGGAIAAATTLASATVSVQIQARTNT